MVFLITTKHKTTNSINFNLFLKISTYYKNFKFSVFTLQYTKVGESYGRKIMHGVMKTKVIDTCRCNKNG